MATLREVADRVSSLEEAATVRRDASERGETVVLTNGCFDLLHSGHLHFLESASSLGDHLWIALNGDASIRALKGPSRPLQTQLERAYALLSLKFVSGIFVFETERLAREIRFFKPDIYAKAGDYCLDTINAEEIMEVWYVSMFASKQMPEPVDVYDRLHDLECKIVDLIEERSI